MDALQLGGSRADAGVALAVCAAIVVVACLLTPDPRGYGTHQRLTILPCGFRTLTHLPCPFCGMTTGFALMAHGRVRAAANANVMAPAGFVLTGVLGLLGLYGVVTGRGWLPAALRHPRVPGRLFALLMAFWAINLALRLGGWHV